MISPVMMKGNKAGIRLIISPEATVSEVITCLEDKLQTTGRYYSNIKPITVTFEGKNLTEDEKQQIIQLLNEKVSGLAGKAVRLKKRKRNLYSQIKAVYFI